jgi:hypothetical protein
LELLKPGSAQPFIQAMAKLNQEEAIERLLRDIEWLERRGFWSERMFHRALRRCAHHTPHEEELIRLVLEHADPAWRAGQGESN